jgi:Arc/MetJ-type ribon-helix-helix transcriptional regulator
MAETEIAVELPEEDLERLEWACKVRGFHSLDECVRHAVARMLERRREVEGR